MHHLFLLGLSSIEKLVCMYYTFIKLEGGLPVLWKHHYQLDWSVFFFMLDKLHKSIHTGCFLQRAKKICYVSALQMHVELEENETNFTG